MKKKTRSILSDSPPPIILQQRDVLLLESIGKYRYLTTQMIHDLIFPGRSDNAVVRRLYKLYRNGFLDRVFIPESGSNARGQACYFLAKNGYDLIVETRGFSGRFQVKNKLASHLFLTHTLAIIAFRLRLESCFNDHLPVQIKKDSWLSEYDMNDPLASRKKDRYLLYNEFYSPSIKNVVSLYPDASFVLQGKGEFNSFESLYFLEIDRGTEPSAKIKAKADAYKSFYDQRIFSRYAEVSNFIVLFYTSSARRKNYLINNLADSPGFGLFLFSDPETLDSRNILTDLVWLRSTGELISILK
ncbi:MAG: replication-relaxation family protein [Leptospiraceae bacterium]|nr:replication-relaxation family protein [Leptospiraceae bacterium]